MRRFGFRSTSTAWVGVPEFRPRVSVDQQGVGGCPGVPRSSVPEFSAAGVGSVWLWHQAGVDTRDIETIAVSA